MKYNMFSHRDGIELLRIKHLDIYNEIIELLNNADPFPHGKKKGNTIKDHITDLFLKKQWEKEWKVEFNTSKNDFVDLYKDKIAIEMEWSRFEMFFRDFFRFMLLYEKQKMDVGIILTYDEMAYKRWSGEAKSYKSARASLKKVEDFLKGDYSSIITVPLVCIGIE